ncbi:hypothetical protein BIFGAL_03966 [Bifidobacterium gallicum DSM 20093 = LMG 11596]|uniref:Uncharacterized protein n=1 Tax=Bifidobacterium gallicum DSM 20093 = LMG 11596 TaxID=561180 RepID=D1NVS3_9BIFI|nr:hypothetical protein BIFGAL_03966 [Bifidobacterium gallicum DSM 20093 = LMG 11596]
MRHHSQTCRACRIRDYAARTALLSFAVLLKVYRPAWREHQFVGYFYFCQPSSHPRTSWLRLAAGHDALGVH